MLERVAGDPALAEVAFSDFCERVWLGLPSFKARGALRGWAYACARNALRNARRAMIRRARRERPLTTGRASELARELTTASAVRRDRQRVVLDHLIARLDDDERMMLVLRIDRKMEWLEIVEALEPGATNPAAASARLRKRYERVVAQLKKWATEARVSTDRE
jgi:RNA polymerase sigma factor (sigma-70 family)